MGKERQLNREERLGHYIRIPGMKESELAYIRKLVERGNANPNILSPDECKYLLENAEYGHMIFHKLANRELKEKIIPHWRQKYRNAEEPPVPPTLYMHNVRREGRSLRRTLCGQYGRRQGGRFESRN